MCVCVFLLHVVARSGALVTGQDNDPAACIVSVGSILCCAVCINMGVGNCVCVCCTWLLNSAVASTEDTLLCVCVL